MDFEILLSVTHGLILGTILGCIPGMGVLAAVLFSMPFLVEYNMMPLVLFYLALIISTQYTGSIVATYFGVPGELTSAPASKLGFSLHRKGQGDSAIVSAALGSMLATFLAAILVHYSANYLSTQAWIHRSVIYVGIILSVITYLCFINRRILLNFLLVLAGLLLGSIGNKHGLQEFNFAFGQEWLEQGLIMPLIIVIAFVIPNLWIDSNEDGTIYKKTQPLKNNLRLNFYLLAKYKWSMLRGTIIGCISGLIPGIGTSVSSNMSWGIEKNIKSSPMNQLVAAESANNSAMITSMIPLILFGIPILASESLILEVMESHGEVVGILWFTEIHSNSDLTRLEIFSLWAIAISIIMYIVATYFAIKITNIVSKIPSIFFKFYMPTLICTFFVAKGYTEYQMSATFLTIFLCVPVMIWAIKTRTNTLPLVFSSLLAPTLLERGSVVLSLSTNIW